MEQKMTFEEANDLLEETVAKLSDKSVSLAESIELYSKACELLSYCVNELEAYKGKITELHEKLMESTGREGAK